jgi:hypothetical protein
VQQSGSQQVDLAVEAGVYVLYDGNRVIYVGRVTEARLGQRLWDHTRDRLTGRWDRFSWFGVRKVQPSGKLSPTPRDIETATLIATMEALLIEGLEPPQNRRQGDGFMPWSSSKLWIRELNESECKTSSPNSWAGKSPTETSACRR